MPLPRKFVWLGEDDSKSTHLELKKGQIYPTSAVSNSILIGWMKDGLLKFIANDPGEEIPADVMLEVQDGTIDIKDLLGHIEAGLKREN